MDRIWYFPLKCYLIWFNRPNGANGFDIVIANPPYVEAKKLKGIANNLKNYMVSSGTADLSVYFLELGLNLLTNYGTLCYITTNKFFNTGYGKNVREMLVLNLINELVNFEQVEVFEGVLVSSVILRITKNFETKDNKIKLKQYYRISNRDFKKIFTEKIENYTLYPQSVLSKSEWSFVDLDELLIKAHIEKGHPALGTIAGINIYRGVTTGYNPAFIINKEQNDILMATDPHSSEVVKKMLQGRNIRKWYYNESDEYLIFTRRGVNIDKYPAIREHLFNFYNHLIPRMNNETKEGRKPGNYKWYEILDNTAYYMEFEKSKLVWGLTADRWAFALDNDHHYLPSNAWILTSSNISLKYILGILNSDLIRYYFSFIGVMTAGGAFTLKGSTISKLPLCVSNDTHKIETIVDSILQKKLANHEANVSDEEKELNEKVYELYGIDKYAQEIISSKVNRN